MSDTETDTPQCQREDCDGEGNWHWWNGMGAFGPYCDGCARDQLSDGDSRKTPIQRVEDCSDGYVVPAGIIPADATLPCIRTKEAFDIYLETDGEEPRQCHVGWCSKLRRNCEHGDDSQEIATDGGTDQHVESAPHDEGRFAESTKRTYGVVDDSIPEEDIYRHDENPVMVSQFKEDGEFWLHVGSRVDLDTTIMFDSVSWEPGDYTGTLWFNREVGDDDVSVGNIDKWHPATPQQKLGLVGEWLAERIDLSEYRAGVDCPQCDAEILHIGMHSTCESVDCDFYCEGYLQDVGLFDPLPDWVSHKPEEVDDGD